MIVRQLCGILIALFFGAAVEATSEQRDIPRPAQSALPITINVVHAINPRFEKIADQDVERVLVEATELAKVHLGAKVNFNYVGSESVVGLLQRIPEKRIRHVVEYSYDMRDSSNLATLASTLRDSLNRLPPELLKSQVEFWKQVEPDSGEIGGAEALSRAMAETLVSRGARWFSEQALDGESVLNRVAVNEWLVWYSLGHSNIPFELVLTNQPIISAEYYLTPVPQALRGGLTLGTVAPSASSRYGIFMFVSNFALLNDFPYLLELRAGEVYDHQERIRLTAALIVHEIGHFVFRYGHPYSQPECIMHPISMLYLRRWYSQLTGSGCRQTLDDQLRLDALPIRDFSNPG